MKLFCSLLQLLLYLAVTGRYNHAYFQHLFYQIDDVYYVEIPEASDPPQMLTADEVEDQSDKLTVNWTTPEAPGPLCPVTNYSVTWDNTNTQVLVDSAITSDTHFTISNLEAYTNYNVCVVAINSLYSEPNCTVSQTDQDKPGVPGNLTVDCIGARSLSITWSYPDEPRGIITNYIVTWNTTDEDNVTEAIVEANITEYTVKDLEPCTTYNITLRAATCKGYGDQEVNVTTTDAENAMVRCRLDLRMPSLEQLYQQLREELRVAKMEIRRLTEENKRIRSNPPVVSPQVKRGAWSVAGQHGTKLKIKKTVGEAETTRNQKTTVETSNPFSVLPDECECSTGNATTSTKEALADVSETSLETPTKTIENVLTNSTSGVMLPGECESTTRSITTDDAKEVPASPQSVSCRNVTSPRNVTVSWQKPTTKCVVRGYTVNYTGYVQWSDDVETNTTETEVAYVDLTNLTPWTNYSVCVSAVISTFISPANCCFVTTLQAAPGRPENFQKTSSSAKSLTVSWKEPIELNGELTGYLLTWGDDSVNLPADATNYTMSKLHRKTNYNITLQASTLAGCWGEMAQIQEPTENGVSAGAVVGGIVVSLLLLAAIVILVRKRVLGKGEAPGLRGPIPDLPMAASKRTVSDGDIQKSNLRQYIQYLESDTQRGLEEEFASLQSDSPQNFAIAAHRDYNKDKNRFKNIFPFDNARVKLSALNNKTGSDYINASYILNTNNKAYFIAAQGPKSNTTADFWRMVWEQRVYVIIMLTNLVEKGREKCFHYWPRSSESFIKAGSFTIRNHTEEERSFYIIRFLEISEGSTKRLVKQYHFTGWPDFGAPQREEYLLDFIAEIKNSMPTNGDHLLVHCSAGVGRTGTFIGLWNLIDIVDTDNTAQVINVKKTVLDMREYRPHMVQAADQYLYLFKCITAYIEAPHLWNMDYAGADHIYDNTGYDNEEPIYDNIN
ncbi:receptor-type tyrosine-protein phosphatase H isoform X2 [Cherax quadricarinatus]|uniref:receptor-type tyrosine-protein phosphatase H isoform X2 n=1 Tax=Cherax quadricarinatus TaxID=27406 RepID=UPI00387E4769